MKISTLGHLKAYMDGLTEGLEGKIEVMKSTIPGSDNSLLIAEAQGELKMAKRILAALLAMK